MPLLEAFAAKDPASGAPCVAPIGPGGAGHYVKMAHNGIEQGMMSALAEAWELLFKCQHMPLERIADAFESWASAGELVRRPPYPPPPPAQCLDHPSAHGVGGFFFAAPRVSGRNRG